MAVRRRTSRSARTRPRRCGSSYSIPRANSNDSTALDSMHKARSIRLAAQSASLDPSFCTLHGRQRLQIQLDRHARRVQERQEDTAVGLQFFPEHEAPFMKLDRGVEDGRVRDFLSSLPRHRFPDLRHGHLPSRQPTRVPAGYASVYAEDENPLTRARARGGESVTSLVRRSAFAEIRRCDREVRRRSWHRSVRRSTCAGRLGKSMHARMAAWTQSAHLRAGPSSQMTSHLTRIFM